MKHPGPALREGCQAGILGPKFASLASLYDECITPSIRCPDARRDS